MNTLIPEALEILTTPGAVCDPYVSGVENPEMMKWMIKEHLEAFAKERPDLSDADEFVEAFMQDIEQRSRI
jgi:hypothetical protein